MGAAAAAWAGTGRGCNVLGLFGQPPEDLGGGGSQLIEFPLQRSEARGVKCLHFADRGELGVDASKANVKVLRQMRDDLLEVSEAFIHGNQPSIVV